MPLRGAGCWETEIGAAEVAFRDLLDNPVATLTRAEPTAQRLAG
jgi:hypothetical protein